MFLKSLLAFGLVTNLFAQMDDEFLIELENDLTKYSEIATNTKQNVDYMPYVVSVLKNEDLIKLGIVSLREALSLIPGVDISIGMAGVKNPIFRGSNPYAMGQSKLIIDGVVVNDQMFGAYNQYLEMPIDIIHRIEVVRGPGSLMSDVNAYAGSIHVITKANRVDGDKKETSLFTAFGSSVYRIGGFVGSYKDENLELSSDLFYQEHDKKLPAGPDRFGKSADTSQALKNYALGLNASYKGLYLKGRFAQNDAGVSYGQAFSISEDNSDYLNVNNNSLELGYKFNISKDIEAKLSVGYFDEERDLQNKVMPNAAMMMRPSPMPPVMLPNGMYFLVDYSEKTFNENLELKVSKFKIHTITAGVRLSQSSVENNTARNSMNNLQSYSNTSDLLATNSRKHISYYINDLINLVEKTSLQIGVKYDEYSDVENQLSPRLAIVHRYDDNNIYKLMYTRSYREPSWREQYLIGSHYFSATSDMKPESVDAYEAAYIKKFNKTTDLKFNVFYLQNKDQIHAQNANRTFINSGDNELYGLEVEFNTELFKNDKFYMNYSYVDGGNVEDKLASSAQNMVKLYYMYDISNNTNISTIVKYVGEKDRVEGDSRDVVDGYVTADLSASYVYQPMDVTLSASVKNIFDVKYELPAPENTYTNDFQQEGRSFVFRLSKRF